MYTANKINVADRDEAGLVKTMSGGVSEPTDPKHFPELVNSATSPRAMSRLGDSFRERLLSDYEDKSGNNGYKHARGSEADVTEVGMKGSSNCRSPRITAERGPSSVLDGRVFEERGCSGQARQQVGQI